jgi:hypothetical protein
MAKKTKQAKSAVPYLRRLGQDEYAQAHLRNAAMRLREAYGRGKRRRGHAAEDKQLYANVREAATSLRKATSRVQRKARPQRRGRTIAAVALAGGGLLLVKRRRSAKPDLSVDYGDPSLASAGVGPESPAEGPSTTHARGGTASS